MLAIRSKKCNAGEPCPISLPSHAICTAQADFMCDLLTAFRYTPVLQKCGGQGYKTCDGFQVSKVNSVYLSITYLNTYSCKFFKIDDM